MEVQNDRNANEDNNAATSSATKATNPKRRDKGKKRAMTDQDPLVAAIKWGSTKLAKAIKEAGKPDNDVPDDLYDNLMAMSGSFNSTHLSFYHSYLVQHPHIARASTPCLLNINSIGLQSTLLTTTLGSKALLVLSAPRPQPQEYSCNLKTGEHSHVTVWVNPGTGE
ncbi:hypothetical protein C2845_PM05G27960 [Panicum miliaceum]|uniref:Uncharacterized protein n=1 Tax=Panicum miliaceum TaxID=4540 RepID=A0A3L6T3F2_PANMI|nr:hypothetical protein C2845_PM05G27960 [Panicum miliaceum]